MPRVLLSQPLAVKDELCWSFLIDMICNDIAALQAESSGHFDHLIFTE